jgi:transposase
MAKIRRIQEFQRQICFQSPEENFELLYKRFLASDLGLIFQAIPWDELVKSFKIKENTKGPDCIFSPKGKLALMFLKHYACCSDERLIEQLNANLHYQFFCDLLLELGEGIENHKIVSQIRCELGKLLDIDSAQQALASHWLAYIQEPGNATTDATCYESELRHPTDQKLLWEAVEWSYGQMRLLCKYLRIRLPRTKYNKWKVRYFQYSRKRRKPAKEKCVLTRSLLMLLDKLNHELEVIEAAFEQKQELPKKYWKKRGTIKLIYQQQEHLFTTGEYPKNRILSISKDYVRPIVRGKETKKVEFGPKVNKIQIDGISFIEHISFDAFNEGGHFKSSVWLVQSLMRTTTSVMGADAIYATNANRKFATSHNIRTDFKRKGRAGKHEKQRKQLASVITKERASRLEGSFGKEKEHYHLKKIKARTKLNEILWVFMGIHTANALEIGRRMVKAKLEEAA